MTKTSLLQREIKQTRPFRTPGHEATLALLRTADVVRRHIAAAIEPAGITPQQYNVLRILRGAGSAGLPTLEIASRMIEAAPGITRLVDRLLSAGLVERERSTEDRRVVACRISPAGTKLLAGLDAAVDAADASALAGLSASQVRQLIRLLDGIRQAHEAK